MIVQRLVSAIATPAKRRYCTNMSKFRVALIQMAVGKDRNANLENASALIRQAKSNGATLISLPECFNSPYGTNFFNEYSENVPNGQTCGLLSKLAKESEVYLVGGTIPERDGDKLYNTCTVWNRKGELILKYRKMHLFDIDIPGGITFKESEVLSAGDSLGTFAMDGVEIGVGICYDLRFEELARLYRSQSCKILMYPAAFNMTTGPMHWELLQRGRAVDNQVYVLTISPARGEKGYIAWGHSQVTDPWGKVVATAGHAQEILYYDVDLDECDKVRQQIPIGLQRRTDIYDTICTKVKK